MLSFITNISNNSLLPNRELFFIYFFLHLDQIRLEPNTSMHINISFE